MSLHQRIKQKLEEKNLKAADLARATKKSPVAAKKWLDGVSTPTADNLKVIAKFLGTTDDWLLYGKTEQKLDNNISPIGTNKLLPVLSWVQAGRMTAMQNVEINDVMDWHPPLSADDPDGCYYLRVTGRSNSPDYIEGDLILVDPNFYISDLVSGDLVVVRNDTEATFKRLVIESDNRKYLEAMNPEWKPRIIEFEEGMVLVGVVIDATRPLGGSRKKRVRKT
ncbi:LexA family transcriptional regulator [Acinetobacter baumannii]|uniref:Helix-turn-helix family protein n=2 Tax=Acinetobacter baumannii TaxID=470 RepID=A0A837AAX7_ACIBA|nr:LexA family transcriptional regulator [Acinetobacter baumannii]EXC30967.1 helix-turn-helix family protein [Acinetobacter baumannii 951631]EXC35817.1 helix-turn-helix family protein [Acinetobacter baumannii 951631]EXC36220.1 helix-turn-helix family protein [Acinetobacter baumannii 951631]EXG10656.1 helix-turn-helix family protein [Acinetobacter baumannii 722310]EXI01457.1 helix-turn-helix family protein [Acinetobacter baumannii 607805]